MQEDQVNPTQKPPVSAQEFSKKIKTKYPEYKDVDDVVLAQKMIEKYPEYKTQVFFDEVKKKDNSVSSTTNPKLASEGTVGSSGGVKPTSKPPLDINKRQAELEKALKNVKVTEQNMDLVSAQTDELSAIKKLRKANEQAKTNKRVSELETDFYKNTVSKDDDAIAEQRTQDAINQNGIWNNIKAVSKKAYNKTVGGLAKLVDEPGINDLKVSTDPLSDEKKIVQAEALKNKEKLSEEEISQRATAVFKQKEKDNLFIDRANSYLDNLDRKDKELLRQDRAKKTMHLSEDNDKRLKVTDALKSVATAKIAEYKAVESELQKLKEANKPFPEDVYQKYQSLGTEIQGLGNQIEKNQSYIQKNNKDLGTAEQELDLFNREYGDIYNFGGNFSAATGELANGLLGFTGYVNSIYGDLTGNLDAQMKGEAATDASINNSKSLEEFRKTLRTPVESLESVEGFVNYASDLVSNQLPILVATSTGAGGLAAIGASSSGQKFAEMNTEQRKGTNYNAYEMAFAPLLYGGAEVISEIPTLAILKKGGRVIESAVKNETNLITRTLKEKAKTLAKDYAVDMTKEMSGEQFTNFVQNFNDKYVLGKSDVGLLDNTGKVFKDTFTLTTMLKVAPHVAGAVLKTVQTKDQLGELDENARKIIEFSKQLETPGLTETEKTVIQKQIDKATTSSAQIMKSTIDKVGNMPDLLYDEVVSLNSQAGEIKAQARAIFDGDLDNKDILLKGLQDDYKAIQDSRKNILEGNTTQVDVLPLKEQDAIKKEALQSLAAELNPDGTKNITITNEQIVERANELLDKKQSEAKELKPLDFLEDENAKKASEEQRTKELSDFLNELDPEEQVEVKEELDSSPTIKESIDATNTFTLNGEEGVLSIEGQQVVFETKTTIHELGNVAEISDSKLLEYGIEPVQELEIEVGDDYSVQMDGKSYQNPNENPSDAVVIGKNGEYSVNLVNDKGQKRTIRGQKAEQIAYNYKLKELENGTDQQIEQATKDAETAIAVEATAVSETDGDSKQPNKKRRSKKQRSLKQAKEPLTKAESEEIELNRLIAEEELAKTKTTEDEAAPKPNTPADGNIQPRTKPVGKDGGKKPKSPAKESVQKPADGGAVEKGAEVTTKKVRSVKNADFDVDIDANGRVKEIRSTKNGRVISKFKEIKVKPTTENPSGKRLAKNANWYKIEADALGKKTKNQEDDIAKAERKIEDAKINEIVPSDEYGAALQYVAQGGKVKLDSARKETGERNSKAMKWAAGFNKESDLKSIERVAEELASENLDEYKLRAALIEVFSTFGNVDDVRKAFLDSYAENQAEFDRKEMEFQIGQLSAEDFAIHSALQDTLAEDAYFEALSDQELNDYFQQKYDEYEQGQAESARQETTNESREGLAESDSKQQQAKEKSKIDLTLDQLNQWENDLDQFGRENLSMGIPLVVAKGAIQAMKAALKAGKLATEVLQAGLDYVRNTQWFKALSQTEQSNIESDFQANFLNQINAIDPKNDRQAENLLNRAASESISEEEAYNEVNEAFNRSNEALENKKPFREVMKNLYRSYVKKFTDRQFSAKMLLGKSGLMNTKNLMINAHGASGLAKMKFQEAYDKIYKGLNAKNRLTLDKIIQARRFIAIDTNREARGLEPVTHPSFIDKNKSEKFLSRLETEIGSEAFADLNKRAEAYFDTYKTLLDEMLDNGLISQESYDSMQDVDYQPRVFLQFVTDFNGDLGEGNKQNNLDSGGLSADQIKSMKEGDASDLVLKSEWLLTNSLLARNRAMAVNNINKRFMTDEFPKAKARFEALDPKNLKGDDVRFYKYFKELESKIIDNPNQGLSKSGKPKYKYDKTPLKFQKAYYYINGKQHQFFIEKELHEAWFDNVEGIMGSKTKEFLSYASGSALVKGIATGNNPAFPIVNTPRDFLFTITFSDQYSSFIPKAMGQIAKDVAKSIKEIKKSDSEVLRKYMEYGGAMDFLSSQGKLKKTSVVGKVLQKAIDPKARDTFKKVFDTVTLHKISQYSEMMFRLGIFQRSINNQLKELGFADIADVSDKQQVDDIYNQAVANARGILDFNQGGSVTKDLESVIPYINVAFQGGRVAASAFEKNPTQATAKILQVATIASAVPVGISFALLSMMKPDEDKDKSVYDIYLNAMEGVSAYQKSKYMNIVLPFKNEDGEYMVVKIAKAQELSPIMSVTDDIYNNMIRSIAGKDKKSAGRIVDDAAFTFNSNVMPIDFTSPAGLITRTPAVKAVLTYQTGYDFFRDEPLSNDIGKVPLPVEGANMRSTEDFYKKIGENFGLSPIRTKAFVESMITSPSTNPFVGMLYGGADAASSDKDMKQIGKEFATTIGKSTLKRVVSYPTDFNRQLATNDKLQDQIDNINIEKYKTKAKFADLTKQFIAKEITEKELVDEVLKLDPNDQKTMVNRIKDKIRMQDVDGSIIDIKYEQGADVKALMIMHYYGDITDGSEDSKQIVAQMKRAKGVLTESVIFEYEKLLKQLKSTKKRPD